MTPEQAEEYTQALGQVLNGSWRLVLHAHEQGIPQALGLTTREWVEQRYGGYVRLSLDQRREAVRELAGNGMAQREIGDVLGVSVGTVNGVINDPVQNRTASTKSDASVDTDSVQNRTDQAQTDEAAKQERERVEAVRDWWRKVDKAMVLLTNLEPDHYANEYGSVYQPRQPWTPEYIGTVIDKLTRLQGVINES